MCAIQYFWKRQQSYSIVGLDLLLCCIRVPPLLVFTQIKHLVDRKCTRPTKKLLRAKKKRKTLPDDSPFVHFFSSYATLQLQNWQPNGAPLPRILCIEHRFVVELYTHLPPPSLQPWVSQWPLSVLPNMHSRLERASSSMDVRLGPVGTAATMPRAKIKVTMDAENFIVI